MATKLISNHQLLRFLKGRRKRRGGWKGGRWVEQHTFLCVINLTSSTFHSTTIYHGRETPLVAKLTTVGDAK